MNESTFTAAEIEENGGKVKAFAWIQIFVPLLFFVPYLSNKDSAYVKHFTNNGCILLIVNIIASAVLAIPVIGWIAGAILGVANFIFAIMNAVAATKGEAYNYPVLGSKLVLFK